MKHLQRIRTWLGTPLATLTDRRPKLARFVKFAGAMAVIVGAEMALPSTALTGKPHPTPTPEPRHIDALPMMQAQMTYGDVAGSADWLWRLGTLTQAQVAEKLGTDIALLEQRLKGEGVPSQGYYPLTPGRAEEAFWIGLEGMRQARDDLATFFEDGDKTANAVQDFILLRMQAEADKHQSARLAEKTAAEQAYSAHRATMEEDAPISSDPVAVKLAQASGDANRAWLDASSVLNRFQRKSRTALSAPDTLNQRHPFPNFQQPIPLFEQRLRVAALFMPGVDDTGPDRANGAVGHWRAFKRALTGAVRSTEDQFSHIRCALVFPPEQSGTTAMPVCAVSTPLPIDYDLTGQGCASDTMAAGEVVDLVTSGTHIAGDLCKESWSYPYLSILFTPDSFTVYPPLPAGMQKGDTAPLSLWSVTWAGEDHLLDQPRRFPWDGQSLPFNELGMIHDVKPDVRTPRIWNDFNAARPGTDIAAAITGDGADRHNFSPRNHATLVASSRFLQPMALLNLGADPVASNVSTFFVRRALTDQQKVLKDVAGRLRRENLNSVAGSIAINAQFCKFGNLFVSPSRLGTDHAQMQMLAASLSGPECEAYYAYYTILDQVLRASHAGSWLWLL